MDDDDASSALIAQMLANDYAAAQQSYSHDFFDSMSDDEEVGRKRKRNKKGKAKKAKKVKKPKPKPKPKAKPKENVTEASNVATTGAATDPATGKKVRKKPRKWTDEEEKLFLEALDLYGRDWKSCVKHMGNTRTTQGFTSHAQKHFIKLYIANKDMPAKVRESGEGYTLSGKPLDPNSAAAKAYGVGGKKGKKVYRKQLEEKNRLTTSEPEKSKDVDGMAGTDGSAISKSNENESKKQAENKNVFVADSKSRENGVETETKKNREEKEELSSSSVSSSPSFDSSTLHTLSLASLNEISTVGLSGRQMNDLMLAKARAEGQNLRQKTDSTLPQQNLSPQELARRMEIQKKKEEQKQLAKEQKAKERREKAELKRKLMKEKKEKREAAKREKIRIAEAARIAKEKELYGDDGRTAYSRKRARRKTSSRFTHKQPDSLQFVRCRSYNGTPGSSSRDAQPFRMCVAPSVLAMADLHAHFTLREVIGYLGGYLDEGTRTMYILRAFPGRSICCSELSDREAEMDPVAEVVLRSEVAAAGMQVVGWYHSHPTFQPVPSMVDINNQATYQNLFSQVSGSCGASDSPFVGLIMSPYDAALPTDMSTSGWFHVCAPNTERIPMKLECTVEPKFEMKHIVENGLKIEMEEIVSLLKKENLNNDNNSANTVDLVKMDQGQGGGGGGEKEKKLIDIDNDQDRVKVGAVALREMLSQAKKLVTKFGNDIMESENMIEWNRIFRVDGAAQQRPRKNIDKLMASLRIRLSSAFGPEDCSGEGEKSMAGYWSQVLGQFLDALRKHILETMPGSANFRSSSASIEGTNGNESSNVTV
eukprot:g6331.t1